MEFLAHRLKSGRIEHTTITVRVLPNEPLRLCFMGMEPSLDPDVTCDVQMSKNALPETCSVLEPRGADALCLETMKAWHHLWHSLGAKNSLARAQRAVHWTNTTCYPKPIAEILSNTHRGREHSCGLFIHGHDSFENSKGENAKCCPPLPQALSIKGDVMLGIPHSRLVGRKWRCVGVERP